MIREFKLLKTDRPAMIEILEPRHIGEVLHLQDETRTALPDAQKMFVLPQKPEYFEALLSKQTGLMIGIRSDGKLIAQMALMGPLSLEDAVMTGMITRNMVKLHHAGENDQVVVAKSMAVHPDFRGNELSAMLLDAALAQPMARAADHIFAQVSADNMRSWDLFLRNGFGIVAAAIDPNDGRPRFILQRPALGFSLHETASIIDVDPTADFAAIVRLTSLEGLIGCAEQGEAFRLAFYPSTELAAAWGDEVSSVVA